jgi:trehalose/maltose transport system substrate-binding protein
MNKLLVILGITSVFFGDALCETIRMTCRSKGRELELCEKAVDEWVKKHGGKHSVDIVPLPHASNECFALYQQWLSAETFDIDILQMDFPWVGIFSDYLYPLDSLFKENDLDLDDYFSSIRDNMYRNGKIVALPWYTDCGVMYYRSDLLKQYGKPVPETWEELYDTALYIQNEERKDASKKNKFYGLVLQAKAFEILTCNFVELIDSFGGAIVDENGKIAVNSEKCLKAMEFMVKCIKNITSSSILNYSEEDARGVFQSGNAVFMRNWPYAWALMSEPGTAVSGKIGVMPIPPSKNGGKPSGVLGGWFLTVSKYSKHTELAADLAKFLTSKSQQKIRANYSYSPTFKSMYSDKEILRINPFFANLYKPLENAVTRPSLAFGKNYSRASSEIFNSVNTTLTENVESREAEANIRKAMDRLNKKLQALLEKKSQHGPKDNGSSTSGKKGTGFVDKIKRFFGFGNN